MLHDPSREPRWPERIQPMEEEEEDLSPRAKLAICAALALLALVVALGAAKIALAYSSSGDTEQPVAP